MSASLRAAPVPSVVGRVALLVLAIASCSSPPPEPLDPAERLARWNGVLRPWLESLGTDDVGHPVEGAEVPPRTLDPEDEEEASDEEKDAGHLLQGAVFLGPLRDPESVRLQGRVFLDEGELRAWIWLEPGDPPVPLPECDPGRPGHRARLPWGAIHTWRQIRPEHGVLVSPCPPERWLPQPSEGPGGA